MYSTRISNQELNIPHTCNKSRLLFLLFLSKFAYPPVKEICHNHANRVHPVCILFNTKYISFLSKGQDLLQLSLFKVPVGFNVRVSLIVEYIRYLVCKQYCKVQYCLDRFVERTSMCWPSSTNCHARSVQFLATASSVRFTSLCQPRSATWPYIGVGDASVKGLSIRPGLFELE